MDDHKDEIVYEPVPGYRRAFHIIFVLAVVYLGAIFYASLAG